MKLNEKIFEESGSTAGLFFYAAQRPFDRSRKQFCSSRKLFPQIFCSVL